ncbi:MAG: nicotinate (nicotinamide) nucleotide adenylyltransferase [Chloroflexi bacterium]|nr:nicotinate (nicotinamide) nucleotide adenylyltransferase [Chloroflexota bacterium]
MRLGILGGTFDPVHRGHLALAHAACDELGLDEVLFLPAGQPWRKAGRMIASNEHRLAMLRRALEGEAAFPVSTLELERPGPSYTADTLEALRDDRPEDELFSLLGEDALTDLPNWARPQRILELAMLAVARRADTSPKALEETERQLPGLGERVIWLKMSAVAVSATEIRERVRAGQPIGDLAPVTVEEYIREQGLYRE